jgi:hypothetical protein
MALRGRGRHAAHRESPLRSATSEVHVRSSGRLPTRDDYTNDERFASAYYRGVSVICGQSPAARVYSM